MIQITPQMRLLLAVEPVDFRKGIDGLVQVCRQRLDTDPIGGAVFIFSNRRRRALKILMYDGQGFWLCQAWNWVQPNGQLRDMVARSLMLELHRAGHIELPAKRMSPPNNAARHRAPERELALAARPQECSLAELGPLEIRQVRRTPAEELFGSLIEAHHYLAYTQPVGEHLKYLVCAQGQPVAALAWSSAPRHLGPRDRFIGWSAPQRRAHIHLLAYNTRFLILPWVRVPRLASHLLARVAGRIAADWQQLYGHPVYLLETFIDPERFRGTCYRAANWIYLGLTAGLGKDSRSPVPNRSFKQLWVYPLRPDFRRQLCGGGQG